MKSNNRVVDPILTQLGMEYRQKQTNFVADRVAPWVKSSGSTGTYYIADALNNLGVESNAWSYTEGAKMVDSVFTSAAFRAQRYALAEAIPNPWVRDWLAGGDDLKRRAVSALQDKMLLAREIRVEALFDAVSPVAITSTACWNSTAANPRANVNSTAAQAILKRIGRPPNAVVINPTVWYSIIGTQSAGTAGALIIDAIKYTQPGLGSALTPELVAQYLNVDYVFPSIAVSGGTNVETTTANANGLAAAGAFVWDADEVYVMYLDPNPGPQSLSYMLTFGPEMLGVDQYTNDQLDATIVRCSEEIVEAVTCSNAIYAIGTVTTG
jgi:hypothetical protein